MNVLSIQSHVVFGRVGNRSAVFPLERMGINVWPLNTVQYSSHTGKPGWTGTAFGADHLLDIIDGLNKLGCLSSCDAVLSGYIGDMETGMAILEAVRIVKSKNPKALYCCDPVMGDHPGGLYVQKDIPAFFQQRALAMADVVIPNRFEAQMLSGLQLSDRNSALKAVQAIAERGPSIVLMTSYPYATDGGVGFLLADHGEYSELSTPVLPFSQPVKGSGDLLSALFLGNLLISSRACRRAGEHPNEPDCSDNPVTGVARAALGAAASSLYSVLEASVACGSGELALLEAQDFIAQAPKRFSPISLM